MVVRIRLARFGKRNQPFYNIVVAQAKSGRNDKPMEVLGTYDPVPREPTPGTLLETDVDDGEAASKNRRPRKFKDVRLDTARTKYWLGVGAQPSEPVWRLLSMVGLVERRFREEELRARAGEADERHRAYWAAAAAGKGEAVGEARTSGKVGDAAGPGQSARTTEAQATS